MSDPADILIVDDTLANLQVLGVMLRQHGHKVRAVPSGKLALQACSAQPPDLILLDITMPEMNGYEVCARLKADPALKEIPVIFISALHDAEDKVRAFREGGVDYITKPFQIEEVATRVALQLSLRSQRNELRANYEKIRSLEDLRKKLVRLIVHDLRNPLNAIKMYYEMIGEQNPGLADTSKNYLRRGLSATNQLVDLANSLLDLSRLEEGCMPLRPEPVDLAELCQEVVANATVQIATRRVSVSLPEKPVVTPLDRSLMRRVIQNILGNALKFTDRVTGVITLKPESNDTGIRITITDNGPGIPREYHAKIFEPFGQVAEMQIPGIHSTGLGLNFCKLATEAHGGKISVESTPGNGTTFVITLPRREPAAA